MGLEIATIAAMASAGAAVYGIVQNEKARDAQNQARAVAEAGNKQKEMDDKRQQIRAERVQRARILQSSSNTGTTFSSGEAGAIGSIETQLSANMGTINSAYSNSQEISGLQQQAADASSNAQMASAVGQMIPSGTIITDSIFKNTSSALANTYAGENRQRLQR
jgi:hypothetical protein